MPLAPQRMAKTATTDFSTAVVQQLAGVRTIAWAQRGARERASPLQADARKGSEHNKKRVGRGHARNGVGWISFNHGDRQGRLKFQKKVRHAAAHSATAHHHHVRGTLPQHCDALAPWINN